MKARRMVSLSNVAFSMSAMFLAFKPFSPRI